MQDLSWMLARLDQETRIYHVEADADRLALLGASPSRGAYIAYLAKTYAFEAPVEWRLLRTATLRNILDVKPWIRTGLLAADLATFDRFPDVVPTPPFDGVAEALGWMYVLLRGRLLHGMLHRHLAKRLPDELAVAGSYLGSSSPLGARWQLFATTLEGFAGSATIADQVIGAAQSAFRGLRHAGEHPRVKAA